jgi:hypothetical protein
MSDLFWHGQADAADRGVFPTLARHPTGGRQAGAERHHLRDPERPSLA